MVTTCRRLGDYHVKSIKIVCIGIYDLQKVGQNRKL